jgi:hypothetical protein
MSFDSRMLSVVKMFCSKHGVFMNIMSPVAS